MNHPALEALTRRSHTAGALTLRPLTAGTHMLCQRCRIGLVDGRAPDGANFTRELLTFAWIHATPIDAVITAVDAGEGAVSTAVVKFADALPVSEVATLATAIPNMIVEAMSALVEPVDDTTRGDFDSKNASAPTA